MRVFDIEEWISELEDRVVKIKQRILTQHPTNNKEKYGEKKDC